VDKQRRRKKKKNKFTRRRKKERIWFQHPKPRFPRLFRFPRLPEGHEDELQLLPLLRQMRTDYPPPYYDPYRDGVVNTAESIISRAVGLTIEKLKEKSVYHGLSDEGTRFEMVRALYLHYRSRKLELGFPLVAYGENHENENPALCDCGKVKADSSKIKRFPRLPIKRFPRLPKRFPRLPENRVYDMRTLYLTDRKLYDETMKRLHG
jgi:hypothetical protein